jgi:hypothetical protein
MGVILCKWINIHPGRAAGVPARRRPDDFKITIKSCNGFKVGKKNPGFNQKKPPAHGGGFLTMLLSKRLFKVL